MEKNYYGFDHEAVNKQFKGELTYINDFCINGEYYPVAVYKVGNPNRKLGHKDYLLLQVCYEPALNGKKLLIRGMDKDQMEEWRHQSAVHCLNCGDVFYSVMRHDNRSCECGMFSVDGGRDYTKLSFEPKHKDLQNLGLLDLLTDDFKVVK